MQGTSKLLALVKVCGDRKPYLQIDRVEGLVAVAQTAVSSCIPGIARPASLSNRAGWSSISIPRRTSGSEVVEAAKEMRERLAGSAWRAFARRPAVRACTW